MGSPIGYIFERNFGPVHRLVDEYEGNRALCYVNRTLASVLPNAVTRLFSGIVGDRRNEQTGMNPGDELLAAFVKFEQRLVEPLREWTPGAADCPLPFGCVDEMRLVMSTLIDWCESAKRHTGLAYPGYYHCIQGKVSRFAQLVFAKALAARPRRWDILDAMLSTYLHPADCGTKPLAQLGHAMIRFKPGICIDQWDKVHRSVMTVVPYSVIAEAVTNKDITLFAEIVDDQATTHARFSKLDVRSATKTLVSNIMWTLEGAGRMSAPGREIERAGFQVYETYRFLGALSDLMARRHGRRYAWVLALDT